MAKTMKAEQVAVGMQFVHLAFKPAKGAPMPAAPGLVCTVDQLKDGRALLKHAHGSHWETCESLANVDEDKKTGYRPTGDAAKAAADAYAKGPK